MRCLYPTVVIDSVSDEGLDLPPPRAAQSCRGQREMTRVVLTSVSITGFSGHHALPGVVDRGQRGLVLSDASVVECFS